MKKIFTFLCVAAMAVYANATDVWNGTHDVTWENTLKVEASEFAGIGQGNKLVVEFTNATGEVIELHSGEAALPGTRYEHHIYSDQSFIEVFATKAMVETLKATGLEVCGTGFTATKIYYDEAQTLSDNVAWSGYFWMDSWSTLEIANTAFDGINWADYKAIRFHSEAGRTDYVINIRSSWDEAGFIANQDGMTMTNDYAELSLEGIDMDAKLALSNRLMIQCNKEDGAPFNFTEVELIPAESAVSAVVVENNNADAYNLMGHKVDAATAKGIIIVGGKKVVRY